MKRTYILHTQPQPSALQSLSQQEIQQVQQYHRILAIPSWLWLWQWLAIRRWRQQASPRVLALALQFARRRNWHYYRRLQQSPR